jgi:hypothetical protein
MKTKKMFFVAIMLLSINVLTVKAQDWNHLNVSVKKSFNPESTAIYIEPIMPDYIMAGDIFKSSLTANGYKVVTDKKDADLIIAFTYKDRDDVKCSGGRAMKKLEGKIYGATGIGETMVLFNFSQTNFETKCTPEVFNALCKMIRKEMLKK